MSAEQPEGLPDVDGLAEDAANNTMSLIEAARNQFAGRSTVQEQWRAACAQCLNTHKLAIMGVSAKLTKAGIQPGSEEFGQLMNQAVAMGKMLAQNPFALRGLNGTKPDVIPIVRPHDTMVGGTYLCAICFQASAPDPSQSQSGLIVPQLGFSRRTK
jgi:hypothetical protein